jgi:hypothetical protein
MGLNEMDSRARAQADQPDEDDEARAEADQPDEESPSEDRPDEDSRPDPLAEETQSTVRRETRRLQRGRKLHFFGGPVPARVLVAMGVFIVCFMAAWMALWAILGSVGLVLGWIVALIVAAIAVQVFGDRVWGERSG